MSYNGAQTARYIEPPLKRGPTFDTRWRYWYSSIADILIRKPTATHAEIALQLGKHPNTIGMIVGTDLFKEYFHQRREAWRVEHDFMLKAKLTDAAACGLDIVLEHIKTKGTQIPLQAALKITESALDRLGYAPDATPQVVVNNTQDNRQQTVNIAGLSASDLEEARAALRRSEQVKIGTSFAPGLAEPALEQGVGLDVSDVVDVQVEGPSDAAST